MTDLLLETSLDDEQKSYVDSARSCAESLLSTLNAALEFSEITSGSLSLDEIDFALPETLNTAVSAYQPAADSKGLQLICTLVPGLPAVAVGDPFRLRRLLAYLLDNAIKFTQEGCVEFRGSARLRDEGGFELICQVNDTGIGIHPDNLKAIFESFTQLDGGLSRNYPGLGLGLAIAGKIAQLMGGGISVESEPGAGSRFLATVRLRLPDERPSGPDVSLASRASLTISGRRILVAEDNAVAQTVTTHVLERAGCIVTCVGSGMAAIREASGSSYDLILMDLHMPDLDGFETARRILNLPGCARTPILALTADVSDETRRLCRLHGMRDFIAKPVQSDELLSALSQHLQ